VLKIRQRWFTKYEPKMIELLYLENGVLANHRLKDFTFTLKEERVTRGRYSKKAAK
jgi:hypothetical protein